MTAIETATGRSPLHHWHVAHGAHLVDRDGWWVPAYYSSISEEAAAARARPVLADISTFAKVSVMGNQVATIAQTLLGDRPSPPPGAVSHFEAPGRVLICRLTYDRLLLLTESIQSDLLERLEQSRYEIISSDATSAYAAFWLAGPGIDLILPHLSTLDVSAAAFPPASCAETSVAGVHCLVARPPESDCVHLLVACDVGQYVWETLLETGGISGLTPVGLNAWEQVLRI